jgi:hypothetical protein
MKIILCIIIFISFISISNAQTKVANYSTGNYGAENYEEFSFWIKDGKRTEIEYTYGKDKKEVKLKYLGKGVLKSDTCFKLMFSNKYILYIIPQKLSLKVTDSIAKYVKTFSWRYEGPVNGIGTFCDVCAEDERSAMKIIQLYYMK